MNIPNSSSISPALLLHASSTLILVFLVKIFKANITQTLSLHSIGIKWGFIALVVAVLFWAFDHWLTHQLFNTNKQDTILRWQQANSKYWWITVFMSSVVVAPIFEELLFRGLILNGLKSVINFTAAMTISALLFTLIHWSWPDCVSLFIAAIIYTALARLSKSIWTPIIAHATHNYLTYLYFTENPFFLKFFS